jgi:hypothetical protein
MKTSSILTKNRVSSIATIIPSIQCPTDIMSGDTITKVKRHELFGQVAGGAGSRNPEEFQRQKIIEGTGLPCPKTNIRIHLRTHTLTQMLYPNKNIDGYDYSEDFDGIQIFDDKTIYVNLKCIVGKGGNQTRSLREVYWFIEGQLKVLLGAAQAEQAGQAVPTEPVSEPAEKPTKIYFANILDGDEASRNLSKFEYLLSLPEYKTVKQNVYVGDLKTYFEWFKTIMNKMQYDTIG